MACFISVAGVTPPGISLVPAPWAAAIFGSCSLATFLAQGCCCTNAPLPPAPPADRGLRTQLAGCFISGVRSIHGFVRDLGFGYGHDVPCGYSCLVRAPSEFRRALFTTFLLTGTLVSLLALLMVALRRPALLYAMVHGRATATFIVPGELAGYLLLLIPTALGVALVAARRRCERWASWGCCVEVLLWRQRTRVRAG